jgi:hypothetical protein
MMRGNPQITAIAFLVKKFGKTIPGGYEVRVTASDLVEMSPHGTFQEVPDIDGRGIRWQYFPNEVIDLKPEDWKESAPETAIVKIEKKDG